MKALHSLLATLTLLTFKTWALPYSADSTVILTITETVVPIPLPTSTSTSTSSSSSPSRNIKAEPTTFVLAQATTTRDYSGTEESSVTAQPILTLPPQVLDSSTEATTTFTGRCEYSFCDQGTNVCFYWAGVTSWDVSRGPLPGEVPTRLGPCEGAVATTE